MPARKPSWNPVRAPRGEIAHAMTYGAGSSAGKTACGKPTRGWIMCLSNILNCEDCKLAIGHDCRPRSRRRRRR